MRALVSNRGIATRIVNAITSKSIGGTGGVVQDGLPKPTITSKEILVKVKAVALNPTDNKHLDMISPPNSIIGCDYAGVVEQVGNEAQSRWSVGDRVAGMVHGGLFPEKGAFASFLKIDADLAWKVPDGMADTDAVTYGISASTAMLNLNVRLGLPFASPDSPNKSDETIFIYAGSTSAGLFHIQLAKAAGCSVVTTASPHSFDLVRRYGADAVYDYKSPTVAEQVAHDYPSISKAVDCFSEGKSTSVCADVIKNKGGKVMLLLPNGKSKHANVTCELAMVYTVFGQPFQWLPPVGPKFETQSADRAAQVQFYETLPRVLHLVKPIPTMEQKPGFEGILEGLGKLRAGQVSGGKLVVRMDTA